MGDQWWTAKAEKIGDRSWIWIRDGWIDNAPAVLDFHTPPDHPLTDEVSLRELYSVLTPEKPVFYDDIQLLRSGLLVESLYLLKKATSVLGAAQVHITTGVCSWSLSSAYHAAFFAMKAINQLLGIALLEVDRAIFVDVWPPAEPLSHKARKRGEKPKQQILTIRLKQTKIEHQAHWAFFLRLLRKTSIDPAVWPGMGIQLLLDLAEEDFVMHRNQLHYQNTYWPFISDLESLSVRPGFGEFYLGEIDRYFDPEIEDFPVVLAILTVHLGMQLIRDLATQSPFFADLLGQSATWMNHGCFGLYRQCVSNRAVELQL